MFVIIQVLVRLTDEERITIEKMVCYSIGGDIPCHTGPHRETLESVRRTKHDKDPYCGLMEGPRDRVSRLRLS